MEFFWSFWEGECVLDFVVEGVECLEEAVSGADFGEERSEGVVGSAFFSECVALFWVHALCHLRCGRPQCASCHGKVLPLLGYFCKCGCGGY